MERNKYFFFILVFFCVLVIAWASYGVVVGEKEEAPYQVSVIVNDSNNDRWIALRQGLEQAAKDYHVALNYVSTGKLQSSEEEHALIRRELESGAQGMIVQMISDEPLAAGWEEFSMQAAVVLLESDGGVEYPYVVVGPDNEAIGRAVAKELIRDFGNSLTGKKIGILSGGSSGLAMKQRQQGLEAGLQGIHVVIAWNITHMEGRPGEEKEQLAQLETVDIMIALDNAGTEQMVDAIGEQDDGEADCVLYGIGGSEKAVYYLDRGVIKTLVVPNEFKMGYESMEAVANELKFHAKRSGASEDYQVDYLVINQDNMYNKKNQKLLFPIVQ